MDWVCTENSIRFQIETLERTFKESETEGTVKKFVSQNDWEEIYRKSLGRVAIWGAVTILAIVMALVGLFLVRISWVTLIALIVLCIAEYVFARSQSTRLTLSWWLKRLRQSDNAITEYAAMVTWQSESLGLEPLAPIEFRRRAKLADVDDDNRET